MIKQQLEVYFGSSMLVETYHEARLARDGRVVLMSIGTNLLILP